MCVECYYPPIPPSKEWERPYDKHLIGYRFYDGYIVQELNGEILFKTVSMWFVNRKIKKLEGQGYIIHKVR